MSLDMTSFDAALKQHYTDNRVQNMTYQDNPLLALMPKYENFGGRNLPIPIIFGDPQNRSATFSTAISQNTSSQLTDFVLVRAKDYSIANIDNETLEASQGNANAFLEAATVEIDGAIHSAARSLAVSMYGTGSGKIAQISSSSSVASATITLSNINDITNFEVGMILVASATNGGGSVKAGTASVVGVDRDLGTVTFSAALSSLIVPVAVNDFLFQQGDYDLKIKGLLAWLPSSAPISGDNFFSVDRSADTSRLAGIRFDGSSMPIEEALVSAASRVAREGGKPGYCFVNYIKYADLEKALGSKVQYIDLKVNADIGFRGMQINGPRGVIKVVPDQNCPSERGFMLQLDMWKLYSLKKAPRIIDTDGLKWLRQQSSDGVQVRVGYYAQLGCNAPGYNANINLG